MYGYVKDPSFYDFEDTGIAGTNYGLGENLLVEENGKLNINKGVCPKCPNISSRI